MFQTNQYFDNRVVSIAFQGEQLPATVGVIAAGEYTFDTDKHETMSIISGQLTALLPNQTEWATFTQGQSFDVAANCSFKVKTEQDTAYLCTYA